MINIEKVGVATPDKISDIKQFLTEIDNEFEQSLSSRVNLYDYVTKLMEFGQIVMARNEDDYVGMVAFYSNDTIKQIGVYSILVVKPICRGQEIGTKLFIKALEMMDESGMKRVQLGTSANNRSIGLYERLGFKIISKSCNSSNVHRVMMEYVFPTV